MEPVVCQIECNQPPFHRRLTASTLERSNILMPDKAPFDSDALPESFGVVPECNCFFPLNVLGKYRGDIVVAGLNGLDLTYWRLAATITAFISTSRCDFLLTSARYNVDFNVS